MVFSQIYLKQLSFYVIDVNIHYVSSRIFCTAYLYSWVIFLQIL